MPPSAEWGLLVVALAVSLYATVAAWFGALRGDERWIAHGRRGAAALAVLLALAVVLLMAALIADRFALRYVSAYSARALPLYLKVSALWAGQEGSLLLWAALQALVAAWFARRAPRRGQASLLAPWASALLTMVTAFYVALSALFANPFVLWAAPPADGVGLNPVLRHPAMAVHPPVLYVGYVGLAVPAALALAALIVERPDAFPRAARPWALGSWLFLGGGLLLGARWAYDVLGWGGYWGWDAVENAGLMPWLTATGLLHALDAAGRTERRAAYHAWGIALAAASFLLVILGTFITRSGVIASVHAFALSSIGPMLALLLLAASAGAIGVIVVRRRLLTAPPEEGGAASWRETSVSLTLVLLSTLTASVLIGTLLPTITGAVGRRPLMAGREWFDRVTGPQLAGLVLLMGVCPLAGRLVTGARSLGAAAWPALVGGVLLPVAAAVAGLRGAVTLGAVALIGAAGGVTLAAIGRVGHPRSLGGYLVHVGVLVIALGVVGTRHHGQDAPLVLPRGESAAVLGYELTYEGLRQSRDAEGETTWATVAVHRGGALEDRLYPRMTHLQRSGQVTATPAVRATLREDLYLVLAGWTDGGAAATFRVVVNPLASLIWAGGLVLLLGGAVAMRPGRSGGLRRQEVE